MSNRLIDKAVAAARIALLLGVAVLVLAPAGAWGAADVIRNSGYSFDRPTYYSDQGELVQYEHSGGSPHNVVSTQSSGGEPLFGSALISSGTTPVNGTELLAPGTYPFVCTIHTGMDAELVVRPPDPPPETDPPPEGDPPPPESDPPPPESDPPPETDPPPEGDPPPPESDPSDITVYKAKIGKVKVDGPGKVRKGKKATYKVRITNSGNARANNVKLKVKGRGLKNEKPVGRIAAGKTRTVKVRLKFKKPGKFKAAFKVTSKNAGGRTAKKKIKVRKEAR